MPAKAEQIAERYVHQIRFEGAYFYDNEISPFPAVLSFYIPVEMMRDFLAFLDIKKLPSDREEREALLTRFWKQTGLAEKLMAHKDAKKPFGRECPLDILEFLVGEDVYVEEHSRDYRPVEGMMLLEALNYLHYED